MAIAGTELRPKRKAGRPKGSKNKNAPIVYQYRKLDTFTVVVPKIPLYWKARKQAWLLANIEKHLKQDPLSVPAKTYFDLLTEMEKTYEALRKAGLGSHGERKKARDGIRSKELGGDRVGERSSRDGDAQSVGVGTGISAFDPFGAKG